MCSVVYLMCVMSSHALFFPYKLNDNLKNRREVIMHHCSNIDHYI